MDWNLSIFLYTYATMPCYRIIEWEQVCTAITFKWFKIFPQIFTRRVKTLLDEHLNIYNLCGEIH